MSDEMDREDQGEEEVETPQAPPKSRAAKTRTPEATKSKFVAGSNAGNMNSRARTTPDGMPNARWQNRDAMLMWPEILDWIKENGRSPYEVSIQVTRLTGSTDGAPVLGTIDGNAVEGDATTSPGEALLNYVIDAFHLPSARGPARYEIAFAWKMGAGRIGTGMLNLPSPAEVVALRNARYQQEAQASQMLQQQPPAGAGRPQHSPQQPPPYYGHGMPAYGYGQAPYYGNPYGNPYLGGVHMALGVSEDTAALRSELARMQGALSEMVQAHKEGRAPQIPGVAAPAAPTTEDSLAEKVTARVLMALRTAGIGVQPQAAVAAPAAPAQPAPAAPQDGLRTMVDKMISGVFETAVDTMKANLQKSIKQVTGMGAPDEEAAPAEIVEPPPKKEFAPPFDVAAVSDVRWPNGEPVRYAADKETGDMSPMGLVFSNPYIAEKAMGVAQGLTEALTDAVKSFAKGGPQPGVGQPPAQVVREIPQGATDATPTNNGSGGWPSV